MVGTHVSIVSPTCVEGWSSVRGGWNNGDAYTVFFSLHSDKAFKTIEANEQTCNLAFTDEIVNIKVGISYVSCEKARANVVALSFDEQLVALKAE